MHAHYMHIYLVTLSVFLVQSTVSSCCTLVRLKSEGWTLIIPITTTSSLSLCLTSTMLQWWIMMLWRTASTGLMSALRRSKEPSSMGLVWRLWYQLVR